MNLFNMFNDLKIASKLSVILIILLLGFALTALSYLVGLGVQKSAWDTSERWHEFGRLVDRIEIDILQARRREKDFLLRDDAKYLDQHAGIMATIDNGMEKLGKLALSPNERGQIEKVREQLQVYRTTYGEMAEIKKRLGLDENSGLHGKMRKAVHDVEASVNKHKNAVLGQSMLMMRRHEKDFIQREAEKYVNKMEKQQGIFAQLLKASQVPSTAKADIRKNMASYHETFKGFVKGALEVRAAITRYRNAVHKVGPLLTGLSKTKNELLAYNVEAQERQLTQSSYHFFGLLALTVIIISAVLFFITRTINRPVQHLYEVVAKVAKGDYSARPQLTSKDELGRLSMAFDNLLKDRVARLADLQKSNEERIAQLSQAEKENELLNNSIIGLIRAVAEIGKKDFTVKVPVTEDVTGAIGDSLNLLTRETSKVLHNIQKFSQAVSKVSAGVKRQSEKVISVAEAERLQVQASATGLDAASKTMMGISKDAQDANKTADNAMENTRTALESVNKTINGINSIRGTIGEAEKRIKRLGERSQEITGVVNLINSIAERTHILALNASMHAASAGEAGRGFAVVADEVQRLAENAREATSDISTLVNNIRVETADTVNTMNTVIGQVAEGTRLAEQAGENMKLTQVTTNELVTSVQQIAEQSEDQAKTSNVLRDRAKEIQESTHITTKQLQEQSLYTNKLVELSTHLLKSVSVFKLPQSEQSAVMDDDAADVISLEDASAKESLSHMKAAV